MRNGKGIQHAAWYGTGNDEEMLLWNTYIGQSVQLGATFLEVQGVRTLDCCKSGAQCSFSPLMVLNHVSFQIKPTGSMRLGVIYMMSWGPQVKIWSSHSGGLLSQGYLQCGTLWNKERKGNAEHHLVWTGEWWDMLFWNT